MLIIGSTETRAQNTSARSIKNQMALRPHGKGHVIIGEHEGQVLPRASGNKMQEGI